MEPAGIMLVCEQTGRCKNQLTYVFGHLSSASIQARNAHLHSTLNIKSIPQGWKSADTLTDQTPPTHLSKPDLHPKAFTFPSGHPRFSRSVPTADPWGSHAPLNGTARGLSPQGFLWTMSTFYNRSNLTMLIFKRYNLSYTNHKWVMCGLLFLLPTDLNARYQSFQWTVLHFHSCGKDFKISHKTD